MKHYMTIRLSVTVLLAALLAGHACGGGSQPLPRRNMEDIKGLTWATLWYFPYVADVQMIGELAPGQIAAVQFEVEFPDTVPEDLVYRKTEADPLEIHPEFLPRRLPLWFQETGPEGVDPMGNYTPYDGSGTVLLYFTVPVAGEYELYYWSAVSPDTAGEYAEELLERTPEMERRSFMLIVPNDGIAS